jgi:hypothetical protein
MFSYHIAQVIFVFCYNYLIINKVEKIQLMITDSYTYILALSFPLLYKL